MTPLAKIVEALLFLSPEPVSLEDLRDATQQDEPFSDVIVEALAERPWDTVGAVTGAEPIRTPHVEPDAEEHAVAAEEPIEVSA